MASILLDSVQNIPTPFGHEFSVGYKRRTVIKGQAWPQIDKEVQPSIDVIRGAEMLRFMLRAEIVGFAFIL